MKIKKPILRTSELALLLYVFLIPIEDFFLQDIVGSSSRIAAGVMIILYVLTRPSIIWSLSSNFFYLYFLWAGISIVLWANNPDYYSIFRLFMWMLTTAVIANIVYRNISLLSLVFKVYILSCLYLVYSAITNFISNSAIELNRVDVESINQNLLASQFLICIVYLLFNYFKTGNTIKIRVLIISLIFLFMLGIIASGSRSVLLSVLVSFLLFSPKNYLRLSNIVQVFVIVLIGLVFFKSDNNFTQLLGERIAAAETDKGSNRIIIWKVSLPMIADNPLTGVGYRNFPSEFANYLGIASLESEERSILGDRTTAGTHNSVLETLSELGLIGFVFFFGFQYKLLKGLKRNNWNYESLLHVMLITINLNALFGDLSNLKYFWLIVALGFALKSLNYKNTFYINQLKLGNNSV
jgi:O-antigen ligase